MSGYFVAKPVDSVYPDWLTFDVRDEKGGWVAQIRVNQEQERFWLLTDPGAPDIDGLKQCRWFFEVHDWLDRHVVTPRVHKKGRLGRRRPMFP